jgi:hypothetical protein
MPSQSDRLVNSREPVANFELAHHKMRQGNFGAETFQPSPRRSC